MFLNGFSSWLPYYAMRHGTTCLESHITLREAIELSSGRTGLERVKVVGVKTAKNNTRSPSYSLNSFIRGWAFNCVFLQWSLSIPPSVACLSSQIAKANKKVGPSLIDPTSPDYLNHRKVYFLDFLTPATPSKPNPRRSMVQGSGADTVEPLKEILSTR